MPPLSPTQPVPSLPSGPSSGAREARQPRLHYAWIVAAVTFVTLLGAAGFRAAPGVLIEPLEDDFGWSRGWISAAISVNLVLFGLVGPFAAALMARYGLRRVVLSALVTISVGAALTTTMTSVWQLVLLWGVVVGLGSGCLATVLAATVASRWFVARRGLVVGALTAATATGQLVFLPLLAHLADGVGWRWVSGLIAISAMAVTPLVFFVLKDRPEDVGLRPYGAPDSYESPPGLANPVGVAFEAFGAARRSGAFWLLVGSFFVCGASTNGLIGTHFIPAAGDHGIGDTRAAGLLALIGVFDIVGTLASGWLTDRVDPRRLLFAYYALRGLSLLVLDRAFDAEHVGLLAFMVFYGLDWVATVPPTVALCAQCFGPHRGPVVFGWVYAGHQIGAAAIAWFAGASHGWTGSYRLSFVIAGALCLVAAIATQGDPRRPPDLGEGRVAGRSFDRYHRLTRHSVGSRGVKDHRARGSTAVTGQPSGARVIGVTATPSRVATSSV